MRVRAFVALGLAAEVIDRLAGLVDELKKSQADVRWVKPEGMHLTLKFLGDIPESRVEELLNCLFERVAGLSPFMVNTGGLGAFPTLKRPRVIWVGCHAEGLSELASATEQALAPLGFAVEKRPFKPHLTLGRVRSMRGWGGLQRLLTQRLGEEFGISDVSQIVLFRSQLTPTGATYSRLGSVALRGDCAG